MMKKLVSLLAIAALTALGFSAALAGQSPATGVNGSMHDITYLGQAGSYGYSQDDFQRVCIFCHTPHNAQPNGAVPAPLWNHEASTVDLAPYTWAAPANLPIAFDVDPLIGPSRLCMGCHDGVTAVDKHGPTTGTAEGTTNYKSLPGTGHVQPGSDHHRPDRDPSDRLPLPGRPECPRHPGARRPEHHVPRERADQ